MGDLLSAALFNMFNYHHPLNITLAMFLIYQVTRIYTNNSSDRSLSEDEFGFAGSLIERNRWNFGLACFAALTSMGVCSLNVCARFLGFSVR